MKSNKNKKITQKMCDDLLTPIVKGLFPQCLLCGKPTQVAHHHFKKERSLTLRYNFKNLIPLCNGCHFQMKFDEGILSCRIMLIKGRSWFVKLNEANRVKIKPNYETIYKNLIRLSDKTLIKIK